MKNQKLNWKKSLWKATRVLIEVVISGGLVYVTNHPEFIALVPVLEFIRDAWKHR